MRHRSLLSLTLLLTVAGASCRAALADDPVPLAAHPSVALPAVMRFCSAFCVVFKLNGDHYDSYLESDPKHTISGKVTVRSFSPDQVVLDSMSTAGDHTLLIGVMSEAQNSVAGGKIRFLNGLRAGNVYPYELTWGDALATATRKGTVHPVDWTDDDRMIAEQDMFKWGCSVVLSGEYHGFMNLPPQEKKVYALAKLPGADTRLNLNGVWTASPAGCVLLKGKPILIKYRLHQNGGQIRMVTETPGWQHDGEILFDGAMAAGGSFSGRDVLNPSIFTAQWKMTDDSGVIKNADEIQFKAYGLRMMRLSPPGLADAPCTATGTPQVSGEMAGQRGIESIELLHDYAKALCWISAGAAQNDPRSLSLKAAMYYTGAGLPRDYHQASVLAVKGGAAGNDIGLAMLGIGAATGHGDTQSAAAARFFFEKARSKREALHDLSWGPTTLLAIGRGAVVREEDYLPVLLHPVVSPQAAPASAPDCRAKGSPQLDAAAQWHNSQIAFGVKDLPMSACWALLSALQGNVDAQLATAWYFSDGVGVEQSDKAAILWYQLVAKQGDLLSLAYMSNAALYEMLDLNLSQYYAAEARKQPGGETMLVSTRFDIRNRAKEKLDNMDLSREFGKLAIGAFLDFSSDSDAYDEALATARRQHLPPSMAEAKASDAADRNRRKRQEAERRAQPTEQDEINAEFSNILSHLKK